MTFCVRLLRRTGTKSSGRGKGDCCRGLLPPCESVHVQASQHNESAGEQESLSDGSLHANT